MLVPIALMWSFWVLLLNQTMIDLLTSDILFAKIHVDKKLFRDQWALFFQLI